MRNRKLLVTAAAAAAVVAAAAFAVPVLRAQDAPPVTAFVCGVDAGARTASELVLSNTTTASFSLDLVLRDADGTILVDRPGEISIASRQTRVYDLKEEIRRGLPKGTKPYAGIFTVEVHGNAPFAADTILLHVAQYFGTRKAPKAAFVLKPLYREDV